MTKAGFLSKASLALALLASGVALHAQTAAGNHHLAEEASPIEADRPGLGEGASVLKAGVLQVEGGFLLNGESEGASMSRGFGAGNPLIRLGIGRRTELRFGGDGYLMRTKRTGKRRELASGLSDLVVGAKFALAEEKGLRPALTLIPALSLPTKHERFTSGGHDPDLRLVWDKEIGGNFSMGGDFGFASVTDDGRRYREQSAGFELGRPVWREWEGFCEIYTASSTNPHEERTWTFDTGLSIPAGENSVFDVSVGQRVYPFARSWFVGAGFAVRMRAWRGRP